MITPKKIRINVAVDPQTKDVIDELADLMDTSFAKLAGSLLDDALPQMTNLRDAVKYAKADPGASYTTMHLALIEAQRKALEAQSDFLEGIAQKRKLDADS